MSLRYDPYRPWNEIMGREEMFSPTAYQAGQVSTKYTNAPPGLFFAGDPGFPRGGSNGAPRNFAPRVGFAYDLTGDAKTAPCSLEVELAVPDRKHPNRLCRTGGQRDQDPVKPGKDWVPLQVTPNLIEGIEAYPCP
jgi:hypothetical protein